jgi:polyisoprenoid-binding protein YceI
MKRSNLPVLLALAIGFAIFSVSSAFAASAPQDVIVLDPAQTVIAFQLKGNLHTTHGGFHLTSGRITLDPASGKAGGEIVVDTASSNTGNSLRDAEMHDDVLETGTYPEITFVPGKIDATRTAAGLMQGTVAGILTIHGQPHPMTLTVSGTVAGDVLKCESSFVIPYAAWGMKNPSWLMFRVAGEVNVEFSTVARITWAVPQKSGSDQMSVPPR